jgi:hypothetical protein
MVLKKPISLWFTLIFFLKVGSNENEREWVHYNDVTIQVINPHEMESDEIACHGVIIKDFVADFSVDNVCAKN